MFDKLRDGAQKALSAFRDAPVAPKATVVVQAEAPVVSALSSWMPTALDARDFEPVMTPRTNEWFVAAEFVIPEGVMYRVRGGDSWRGYIRAQRSRAGANGVAASSRTINLVGLMRTTRVAPALPSSLHPDITILCRVGSAWVAAAITGVDYSTGVVTYTEPASCTEVEAYYVHDDGEYAIRAYRKLGNSDTNKVTLENGAFAVLHATNQQNIKSTPKWPRDVTLPAGFVLTLEVKSGQTVAFTERAKHVLTIPAFARQIKVEDETRLRQLAELDLRAGL